MEIMLEGQENEKTFVSLSCYHCDVLLVVTN